jgi:hypothetical protein
MLQKKDNPGIKMQRKNYKAWNITKDNPKTDLLVAKTEAVILLEP